MNTKYESPIEYFVTVNSDDKTAIYPFFSQSSAERVYAQLVEDFRTYNPRNVRVVIIGWTVPIHGIDGVFDTTYI